MKKIFSLALCLIISVCSSVSAWATYTENNNSEIVGLSETYVAYNNFENCSGFSNRMKTFSLFETNESNGIVLKNDGTAWSAIDSDDRFQGTYTYEGTTNNIFRESIKQNTNYIVSFDYKYLSESSNQFSFAIKVPQFASGTTDYRHSIPVSTEWTRYSIIFNSGNLTKMGVKINSLSCSVPFYIDNYSLTELTDLSINSASDVLPAFFSRQFN